MPVINSAFDLKQALDPTTEGKSPFGYLTALTMAGAQCTADIKHVHDPQATLGGGVVGILHSVAWTGQPTDPIHMEFFVSHPNQQALRSGVLGGGDDLSVVLGFVAFAYDSKSSAWYETFHPVADSLKANLDRVGAAVQLNIAEEPGDATDAPGLYAVRFQIVPPRGEQAISVAVSLSTPAVRNWGSAD